MTSTLYDVSQDALVHATTEYARFAIHPANRPINQDHLERLYDAIERRNLLREFPILVDRAGTVLDGQHRLKAAEGLGVPIYYIVSTNATIDDIPDANSHTKHWTMQDWLLVWIKRGKSQYVKLKEFWDANDWMTLPMAAGLCHYGDRSTLHRDFQAGEYQCLDLEFANEVVRACLDFKRWVDFYPQSAFVSAVATLHEHAGYSHQRMMERMEYLSAKLVRCADRGGYLSVFSLIYNYKTREDNRLAFSKLSSNDKRRREDRRMRFSKARVAQAKLIADASDSVPP